MTISRSRRSLLLTFTLAGALATCVLAPRDASAAEEIIREPGAHPDYPIEIEPHMAFGSADIYGWTGVGAGLRLSIPIVKNGFIRTINDNVAISFGGDFLHYETCYFGDRCGANYLIFPAALQWNFFLSPHWSVAGEGGVFLYKGFIEGCAPGPGGCYEPSTFGALPTVAFAGRYHISENVNLALRVGYPTITFGVSFL